MKELKFPSIKELVEDCKEHVGVSGIVGYPNNSEDCLLQRYFERKGVNVVVYFYSIEVMTGVMRDMPEELVGFLADVSEITLKKYDDQPVEEIPLTLNELLTLAKEWGVEI